MRDSESYSANLIGLIYDAAIDPARWPAFLSALADGFPGGIGMLYQVDRTSAKILVAGWAQECTDAYNSHYGDINPWIPGVRARASGITTPAEAMLREEDLRRTEFYNDFLAPQGLGTGVGVTVSAAQGSLMAASVLFSKSKGETAAPDHVRRLALCVPHLNRADQINRALVAASLQRHVAEDSLNRLKIGAAVVATDGRALFFNSAAARLFRANDGVTLAAGGYIAATRAADTNRLRAYVRGAAATSTGDGSASGGAFALPRPSGLPPYSVVVTPVRRVPDMLGVNPMAAMLLITERESSTDMSASVVAALYNLTGTESRVATALASGASISEVAVNFGMRVTTVRQHVKTILTKTDTHRQSDLIRILLSGPAVMADAGHLDRTSAIFPALPSLHAERLQSGSGSAIP